MGRRASENWKDIGGSGQSGMQVFRILERDQLYRVVLEREKNIFKELKKLQGRGFGRRLRTMGEGTSDPCPQVFREQEGKPG